MISTFKSKLNFLNEMLRIIFYPGIKEKERWLTRTFNFLFLPMLVLSFISSSLGCMKNKTRPQDSAASLCDISTSQTKSAFFNKSFYFVVHLFNSHAINAQLELYTVHAATLV